MESGLMKKFRWNGSGIYKKIIAEMVAELMKEIDEMKAGLIKRYCRNESGIE